MQTPTPTDHGSDTAMRRQAPPEDRACRIVNADASVRAWRGSARTIRERMDQLRRAGMVCDEVWFRENGNQR